MKKHICINIQDFLNEDNNTHLQDIYNKAIKYLTDKFGEIPRNNGFDKIDFNDLESNDQRLIRLVGQYYLGIAPKRELENLVQEMDL